MIHCLPAHDLFMAITQQAVIYIQHAQIDLQQV